MLWEKAVVLFLVFGLPLLTCVAAYRKVYSKQSIAMDTFRIGK